MADRPKKNTVRVKSTAPSQAETEASTFKPTPEAKSKATRFRIFAGLLWALAIAGEAFAVFWVLRQDPVNMILLIGLIVVIAGLAIGGSLLWKQSNRLDPASRADTVRFFVQNQLGAIITMIAFLPLIIMILLNKDMDGKQKGIAGGIAVALLLVAGYFGTTQDSPSVEQYTAESNEVLHYTGQDLVFWTKSGKVFHLCDRVSAVNLESADNTIYSGTVADAHAAGKERLTKEIDLELRQCGIEGVTPYVPGTDDSDSPTPEVSGTEIPATSTPAATSTPGTSSAILAPSPVPTPSR